MMSINPIPSNTGSEDSARLRNPSDGKLHPVGEVIEAIRQGDHEAFATLYFNYEKPLYHFILSLLGSRDEAEDELQQLFANIWQNREKLNPGQNIKNYLYVAVRNNVFKRMKSRSKAGILVSDHEEIPYDNYSADDPLIARDTKLMIDIAVENMPRIRRRVFELYREGYDNEQIARELDITKENTKKHLTRARQDIRELLTLLLFFFS